MSTQGRIALITELAMKYVIVYWLSEIRNSDK